MVVASGRRAIRLPVLQASFPALHSSSLSLRLESAASLLSPKRSSSLLRRSHHPVLGQYQKLLQQQRQLHSSGEKASTVAEIARAQPDMPRQRESARAPLSVLPMSMILRSLATTTISSSPLLLPPSLRIMSILANSTSSLLNPDRNPLLRYFLKKTFYAQFCAGENTVEVQQNIAKLKRIGFTGVILGYAREVVLSKEQAKSLDGAQAVEETADDIANEIDPWAEGTMETVRLAESGDFVALKFTGAGHLALFQLQHRLPPSPYLSKCIDSICELAHQRGVRLLFDAEQDLLQDGIDDWTLQFARKYNTSAESATIYGTYQAYKKKTPSVISSHLAEAQKEGFTLGIKLVRGAYLGSDPRECFHDTKEQTDACYNDTAASVLIRQWNDTVKGQGDFPNAHIVLATHNAESVRRARHLCDSGAAKSQIAIAQLQGMADEISCELVTAGLAPAENPSATATPVYKYLVWGTTGECMKYLLRRAQENKDAVQRTRNGRDAMSAEFMRRCRSAIGL